MTALTNLRIATRQSPLALWQANHARNKLLEFHPHLTIELLPITTSADRFLNAKLLDIGGKGLFVKELEEALLHHQADFAVHSMKDMPADIPEGLALPIIFARQNPLDAFV
ncbi:MAG: hydroxymethylbilane synthase, partial [Gammaproteobacteria bacterium]|nr:hydroxymethylbilane synthase [Gammaproteobacteria bacterium]